MPVDLAPELLEILACPNCHSALAVDDERDELVCVASDCGLAYPVVDGIPVMLVDEARRPGMPGDASADAVPSDDIPSDDIPSDDIDLSSGSDNASSDSADPGPASPGSASTGPATSGQ
jgi:uncharacterized protein YbaR (Trm112 family)